MPGDQREAGRRNGEPARGNVEPLAQVYPALPPGGILPGIAPQRYLDAWERAQAGSSAAL